MVQWWPVLFVIAFLFLTIIPILVTGLVNYRSEQVVTSATEADPLAAQLPAPRFFASPERSAGTLPEKSLEEMIVAGIRIHLRREQELAAEFARAPSIASLHRHPRRAVLAAEVERFLARELVLANAFVAAPSIESLQRHSNGRAALN